MKNRCDICENKFNLFKTNKLKCWYKDCDNAVCNDCKDSKDKRNVVQCQSCKTLYCETHMHMHGCQIATEELQKQFQEYEDKQIDQSMIDELNAEIVNIDEDRKNDAAKIIEANLDSPIVSFSPNKTLLGFSANNILEQLAAMEECEENGYELIEKSLNSNIILYRKRKGD